LNNKLDYQDNQKDFCLFIEVTGICGQYAYVEFWSLYKKTPAATILQSSHEIIRLYKKRQKTECHRECKTPVILANFSIFAPTKIVGFLLLISCNFCKKRKPVSK
jgi:hypothetical protein